MTHQPLGLGSALLVERTDRSWMVGHSSTTFLRNVDSARTPILKEVYECVIQARRAQRRNRLSKPFFRILKSSFTM